MMKIIKVIQSECSIRRSIEKSSNAKETSSVVNLLDACGCTGNGMC